MKLDVLFSKNIKIKANFEKKGKEWNDFIILCLFCKSFSYLKKTFVYIIQLIKIYTYICSIYRMEGYKRKNLKS